MNYQEALAWLYGLQRFGIKLGLGSTRRLLETLKLLDRRWRIIHVAGTNGKGSVCAMIDSILRAQGIRTGLFTSPHLVSFRERIRVDGQMISEQDAAGGLTRIRDLIRDWDPHPTFFEVVTAVGLQAFAEADVDVAVLETGMGGRLDATNAVEPNVCVITPIAFDHQKWLGNTIAEIAAEKAGIIMPGVPVVSSAQSIEAEHVLRVKAKECNAPLKFITAPYQKSPVGLRGAYQKQNAALALAALQAASINPPSLDASPARSSGATGIDEANIARGLAAIDWPARFQAWDQRTIIDGAHNTAAAELLAATWREVFNEKRATLILAVLADKDTAGICQALSPVCQRVLLPKIRSQRAADPSELARVWSHVVPSVPCSIADSIADALEAAREHPDPILITGSLHFAGEVIALLEGKPASFEECAQ